jgi:intracellular multiplication protein IcmO
VHATEQHRGPSGSLFSMRGMAVLKSCLDVLGWLNDRRGLAITPAALTAAIDLQSLGDLAFDRRYRHVDSVAGSVQHIDAQDMPESLLAPLREYLGNCGYDLGVHRGYQSRRCAVQLHACFTAAVLIVLHDLAGSGDTLHAG